MKQVLHTMPDRSRRCRFRGTAAALAIGLSAACAPALAGDAGSSFRIIINVLPEAAGTCSASSSGGAPQVTCRPSVVGSTSGGTTGAGNDPDSPLVAYRRSSDPSVRLAGELVEVGVENHYAWAQGSHLAWGEYSSRLVVAGEIRYVEMTLAW